MKIFRNCLLFLVLHLIVISAKAQVLIDTIYVNEKDQIAVKFPYNPRNRHTNPSEAPYEFTPLSDEGFMIRANAKRTPPAQLYVDLKKKFKNLRFLIVYKANLSYDVEYNYTEQQLNDRINQKAKQDNPEVDNSTSYYYSLLSSGDKNFGLQLYSEAASDFQKAHDRKPDAPYPTHMLEEIKIKLDEKAKKDRELQVTFRNLLTDGDKKLKANQLTAARLAFEQAKVINPNDAEVKKRLDQLDEKEGKFKQNEDINTNYNTAIKEGDKAFDEKDYDVAEAAYKKAFGYKKIAYPQNQLKKITKARTDLAKKVADDKRNDDLKAVTVKKEKEAQELEDKYNAAVQVAEKYFNDGKLDKAKLAYNDAWLIINRPWPKQQIAKIDVMVKEKDLKEKTDKEKIAIKAEKERREKEAQEQENKYNTAIKVADDLFNANNYADAKKAYQSAMVTMKKPYAEAQVKKIDKIVADQLAKENEEKIRLAKEKLNTEKYNTAIHSADIEFGKNSYEKARKLYLEASGIKPAETYPKQKLDDIQAALDEIAAKEKAERERKIAEAENKKKYDIAILRAKSYRLKDDLENALVAYKEAAGFKPDQQEPQKQIRFLTDTLAEIAHQNEINDKYDIQRAMGDSLMGLKKYDLAITAYSQAHDIKPKETYPVSQIKYINSEIKNDRIAKEENERIDAQKLAIAKQNKIHDLMKRGDSAKNTKSWEIAIRQYLEVLNLDSTISSAKINLRIVRNQWELSKKPVVDNSIVKNEPAKENNRGSNNDANNKTAENASGLTLQVKPLPYTEEELKAKYPGIDFSKLPPEQPDADSSVDSKENTSIFYQVLTEKPRLDINDKSHNVKLICQALHFVEGSGTVYLKLLVQNNSKNDFLTGAMMFTWTRRSGSKIKLYPLYIYPSTLPVIQPGNEAAVIYVCKTYDIGDKDELQFDMSDRLNKIKLELEFKGDVYNTEFIR